MSDAMVSTPAVSPIGSAVRAWFAPVHLQTGQTASFDPAAFAVLPATGAPAGWYSAGPIADFIRKNTTAMTEIRSGSPALPRTLARHTVDATVGFSFTGWSKLALLLSCGTRQINLLAGSTALPLLAGSTAAVLQVAPGAGVSAGDIVVVDDDYIGQSGPLGAGIAGVDEGPPSADVNYVRRVSVNVGRVGSVQGGAVTLMEPLPAGAPTPAMRLARVTAFADREGDAVQRQWSAAFVMQGVQGDCVVFYYPRLQLNTGSAESRVLLAPGLERWRLDANYTALPVADAVDGAPVLCCRSYFPAPMRAV